MGDTGSTATPRGFFEILQDLLNGQFLEIAPWLSQTLRGNNLGSLSEKTFESQFPYDLHRCSA